MDKGNGSLPNGQPIVGHNNDLPTIGDVVAKENKQRGIDVKPKSRFQLVWLWYGLLIIESIGIVVVLGLMASGHLGVVSKKPEQKAMAVTSICNTPDVARAMNKLYKLSTEGATEENAYVISDTQKVVDKVKKQAGYRQDANCVQLIADYAYYSGDINLLKQSITDLNAMRNQGGFISNGLIMPITPETIKQSYGSPLK